MTEEDPLLSEIEAIEAAWRDAASKDFLEFINGIVMPAANGEAIFDDIMADFQREFFEDIAPCVHALVKGDVPPRRRFWLERTKKASKDSDMALIVCWIIAFCDRPILVQVCAASSEQASIIENRARQILHYNPWLNEHLEVIERKIRKKSQPNVVICQIEATGSAGAAQGPTPDLLILNELVHVDKWSVMETHMNNADGVPRGIVIISTNAGIRGSGAWKWREAYKANPDRWSCYIRSCPAPWINEEDIADAKSRDPIGTEFGRLWYGKWVSGMGDAVGEDAIEAAFRLQYPTESPENGWMYLIGLDLGVSHDHAGVAVVGVEPRKQEVKVAYVKGFAPEKIQDGKKEVDLMAVEAAVRWRAKQYNALCVRYDPAAGGSYMAQRLRSNGISCREQSFKNAGQTAMAEAFVTLMKARMLACYDDREGRLRRDFAKLSIEHKPPSGYKLTSTSDSTGHADVGVAVIMCLPQIVELMGGMDTLLKTDIIASADTTDLSKEELEHLPEEFKELWEMYDDINQDGTDWDNFRY